METLTNEFIYNSFILGAKNVIKDKDTLNRINVFPVADGDTGTNLASLMQSIIYYARLKDSTKQTLESIADAALRGSRGNSGIIFASYFDGFYQAVQNDQITIDEYIEISSVAAKIAKSSISNPVDGTVITLMDAWVQILNSLKHASHSLIDLFSIAFDKLKIELSKTTEKLAILKNNRVVDAGAKGFVEFIEGFLHAIRGKTIEVENTKDIMIEVTSDHSEYHDNEPRYCTEAFVENVKINKNELTLKLKQMGNSLVVANHEASSRIHIHTDQPDQVFNYLRNVGHIIEQKVDDMKRQYETAHQRKYDIALVTDSIADIPQALLDKYQIHMYPISLLVDGITYFDKLTINNDMFYDMMNHSKTYPSSSQPNPKSLENLFSYLTTYYKQILVLTVSSKMSGTYQIFNEIAKKFDEDIRIIDTLQNSSSQGLLVYEAAKLIEKGKSINIIE